MGLKILILSVYYERPNMVRNAINTLAAQDYDNWHLAFIDDGSRQKGQPIVQSILGDDPRVTYYDTRDTIAQKRNLGSQHGAFMNKALRANVQDCDIAIVLCDDDALKPGYLAHLDSYFREHEAPWAYCHVHVYDPLVEAWPNIVGGEEEPYKPNTFTEPIEPANRLDASQIAWKIKTQVNANIWFKSPCTKSLDYHMWTLMQKKWGPCPFMNFVGQYKGMYATNLMKRKGEAQFEGNFDAPSHLWE